VKLLVQSTLAIFGLMFALQANATPSVGDKAVFAVNMKMGNQSMDGHVTFELTGYDKATDVWQQQTTMDFNGQTQVQKSTPAGKDLLTDAIIADVLSNCAAKGGTVDSVTAPAGTFQACAVPITNDQGTGTVWVSQVPFGYSKWVANRKDGLVITALLESFVDGSKTQQPPQQPPSQPKQ
jgi:hypothetical protein